LLLVLARKGKMSNESKHNEVERIEEPDMEGERKCAATIADYYNDGSDKCKGL